MTKATILGEVFKLSEFRPGQEAAIDRLLAGRSVLAVFPTGAGKSLCYQLPALMLDGVTLVVSPLIALMKDQVDALRGKGVAAARLDSSLTPRETAEIQDLLAQGRIRILYVAPERLSSERFVNRLRSLRIPLLAVDEAHCISEWGHNFRPDYLKIARIARDLNVGRVLALTATATPSVAADVRRGFGIADDDHVQIGFHRPNLEMRVTPCSARERTDLLIERVQAHAGPTIIYVTLQKTSEEVADRLAASGIAARAYHAGLETDERTAVQDAFMRGEVRVVVATIAFGMGIDKADIRAVYHFNAPKTLENYAQEIGRAGRDGLPSRCEVFACGDDRTVLENFTFGDTPTRPALEALVRSLTGSGDRFDVSHYDLSQDNDIRPLVVSTAITYLELDGTLAHVSPFYSEYKLKLARPVDEIVAKFDPDRASFLRAVFAQTKKARVWETLVLAEAARALGEPRERIQKALDYLEEKGDLVAQVSGLRHAYRLLRPPEDVAALVDRLHALFAKREERDIERTASVFRFLEHPGCLARELVGYFGEQLPSDCGQCSSCRGERSRKVPVPSARPLGEAEAAVVAKLQAEGHRALREPRALARFLCGLPSPATSRAKLSRDSRFGVWREIGFGSVLVFVEGRLRAV